VHFVGYLYIYLDLINAWMMEHFVNIVLIVDASHFKCSFKNADHLPLFPRHVHPCPYKYNFRFCFRLPAFSHNMALKSWKVLPVWG